MKKSEVIKILQETPDDVDVIVADQDDWTGASSGLYDIDVIILVHDAGTDEDAYTIYPDYSISVGAKIARKLRGN
jgi:hypothetical protein